MSSAITRPVHAHHLLQFFFQPQALPPTSLAVKIKRRARRRGKARAHSFPQLRPIFPVVLEPPSRPSAPTSVGSTRVASVKRLPFVCANERKHTKFLSLCAKKTLTLLLVPDENHVRYPVPELDGVPADGSLCAQSPPCAVDSYTMPLSRGTSQRANYAACFFLFLSFFFHFPSPLADLDAMHQTRLHCCRRNAYRHFQLTLSTSQLPVTHCAYILKARFDLLKMRMDSTSSSSFLPSSFS